MFCRGDGAVTLRESERINLIFYAFVIALLFKFDIFRPFVLMKRPSSIG